MKLRQKEFCHNCNQHVMFEFEDITERQVILCPNCGHEHYRELDQGTILDIQIDQTRGLGQFSTLRIAKMNPNPFRDLSIDSQPPDVCPYMEVEERQIVGQTEDGKVIVKPKDGEEVQGVISQRRWGQDPRQRS